MKPMHPRARCAKIVRDCEEFIAVVESWNDNRPDAPPMDCEPERVLLKAARECLDAWDSRDMSEVTRLTDRMLEISKGMIEEKHA